MSTWTVVWERVGERGIQRCSGLTPEVAIFRLRNAIKNSGPIIVHGVHHEVLGIPVIEDESLPPGEVRLCNDAWHHEMHSSHSTCPTCNLKHQHPKGQCDANRYWWCD